MVGRRIFEFSDEAGGSGAAAADSGGNGGNGGGKGGSIGGNGGNGGGNGGGGNGVEGIGKGKGMGNEGRGRAKTVVARRFEKEFREHRRMSEKTMRMVHGKEAREGHWACEGMGGKGGRGRGRKKEGRGVLGGLVGEV